VSGRQVPGRRQTGGRQSGRWQAGMWQAGSRKAGTHTCTPTPQHTPTNLQNTHAPHLSPKPQHTHMHPYTPTYRLLDER
jgi:hypothetical protein